ncbi:SapC family protein, partial [Ideonella sp.]|uniref:SapC family protein n=1 Tax=Ideonella sp. TaxID=1929293 RepID=UPI003BB5B4DC
MNHTAAPTATTANPLYRQVRVLQPARHSQRSLKPAGHYGFAAQAQVVPLLAVEMALAARELPIVFGGGSQPYPLAVLGLAQGQNLCVDDDGQWQAGDYVPSHLRRYPFIFLEDPARRELTLCIDEAATVAQDEGAGATQALFLQSGQPSALTRSALAYCRDYQAHHLLTQRLCQALADADLLVDQRASVTLRNGQRLALDGFRVIEQARFQQLSTDTLQAWQAQGWLAPIHAHLQSVRN